VENNVFIDIGRRAEMGNGELNRFGEEVEILFDDLAVAQSYTL